MIITTKNATAVEEQSFDTDAYVSDFLRQTPDFFARNPELLLELEVPHRQRGAVSLVERRVLVQREQYNELKQRVSEIVDVAHQNDHLSELLHDYSVGLMSAGSLEEVFTFTETILQKRLCCELSSAAILKNDVVEACVNASSTYVSLVDEKLCRSMADLHKRRSVYCGYPVTNRVEQFFPDNANEIKSIAIIRLADAASVHPITGRCDSTVNYGTAVDDQLIKPENCGGKEYGYLALASTDGERFAPHMGTDFLSRFGSLLSARIAVFY